MNLISSRFCISQCFCFLVWVKNAQLCHCWSSSIFHDIYVIDCVNNLSFIYLFLVYQYHRRILFLLLGLSLVLLHMSVPLGSFLFTVTFTNLSESSSGMSNRTPLIPSPCAEYLLLIKLLALAFWRFISRFVF